MKTNKSIDKLIQNKITNDLNNRQKLVSSIVDTKKFSAMLREGKDVKTALKEYKEVDTNKIMSTAKVIWESPTYLDPEVEKKTLVVGPLKAGSMEFIKYKVIIYLLRMVVHGLYQQKEIQGWKTERLLDLN